MFDINLFAMRISLPKMKTWGSLKCHPSCDIGENFDTFKLINRSLYKLFRFHLFFD